MNIYNSDTRQCIANLKSKYEGKNIGFTCSAFDLFHCGHIIMLEDASKQCDVLIVGLHTDPNIDRSNKNIPIQTYEERYIQVNGCKYVDEIIKYATEDDLHNILTELTPDVRVLGSDWRNKEYTGYNLPIEIYWHERNHNWSTSFLRERIYLNESAKHLL